MEGAKRADSLGGDHSEITRLPPQCPLPDRAVAVQTANMEVEAVAVQAAEAVVVPDRRFARHPPAPPLARRAR